MKIRSDAPKPLLGDYGELSDDQAISPAVAVASIAAIALTVAFGVSEAGAALM